MKKVTGVLYSVTMLIQGDKFNDWETFMTGDHMGKVANSGFFNGQPRILDIPYNEQEIGTPPRKVCMQISAVSKEKIEEYRTSETAKTLANEYAEAVGDFVVKGSVQREYIPYTELVPE